MKRKAEDTGVEKRPRDEVVDKVQLLRDLGIAPSNAKGFWTHYPDGEEGFPGSPEFPYTPGTRHITDPEEIAAIIADSKLDGKWLLWYHKDVLDEQWARACLAYEKGLFQGTSGMKCSTIISKWSSSQEHAIVLYCSHRDEPSIMESGRAIMRAMNYDKTMFYKLNSQANRKSSGQWVNHTYRLFRDQV